MVRRWWTTQDFAEMDFADNDNQFVEDDEQLVEDLGAVQEQDPTEVANPFNNQTHLKRLTSKEEGRLFPLQVHC